MGPPGLEGHRGPQGHEHLARTGRRARGGEGDVASDARDHCLKALDRASSHERCGERAPRNVEQTDLQDDAPLALDRSRHEAPGSHRFTDPDGGGPAEPHRGQPQALLHAKAVVSLENRHPQLEEGPRQLVGHRFRDP